MLVSLTGVFVLFGSFSINAAEVVSATAEVPVQIVRQDVTVKMVCRGSHPQFVFACNTTEVQSALESLGKVFDVKPLDQVSENVYMSGGADEFRPKLKYRVVYLKY